MDKIHLNFESLHQKVNAFVNTCTVVISNSKYLVILERIELVNRNSLSPCALFKTR